tara:strand:- start:4458 stop:4634 length:177 start_codon:yes stop_codon:yes gene_type:complete
MVAEGCQVDNVLAVEDADQRLEQLLVGIRLKFLKASQAWKWGRMMPGAWFGAIIFSTR